MARPVGSKNKSKDFPKISEEIDLSKLQQQVQTHHYDLILAVRAHRKGNFRGLWELVELTNEGTRKMVITDANNRGSVITLMNKRMMKVSVMM